ncbi:MAG: glycosyltransferase family 4 protein [Nitrososphaeria archaeon]|jgi:glycosyltransferase involved in cell wall biosynthesis
MLKIGRSNDLVKPSDGLRVGIIMYQTSNSKGQELVAQRMTREFIRLGHSAYLITSPYKDGKRVISDELFEKSEKGYLVVENDTMQIPIIRVNGYISSWPPRRIMFRDFISVLKRIVDDLNLNTIITHSTLWNGPEEVVKFSEWWNILYESKMVDHSLIYLHMSHYQPPLVSRYEPIELAYRVAWNRSFFPLIFKKADLILCTTPIEMEHMTKLGCPPKKLFLYLGVLDENLVELGAKASLTNFARKYNIPEDKKIVSYIGTMEKRKNPLAVAKVARLLSNQRDLYFVLAGRPGGQEKEVKREIRNLNNIKYVGEISDSDKADLLSGSYVNIILSHMEALGLTQIESMYFGVPILTSATDGQRWLVRDKVDGIHLKGPEDIGGAVESLRYLAERPEERARLSANVKERAKMFLMTTIISSLIEKIMTIM